jgi:hypothetical protein
MKQKNREQGRKDGIEMKLFKNFKTGNITHPYVMVWT